MILRTFLKWYKPDSFRFIVVITLLLFSVQAFAQMPITVKGTVIDAATGDKLIGVTVQVKGGNAGTITDLNGEYTIEVRRGQELEFSYIGYGKQTQTVRNSILNIELAESTLTLDQVVVVGYGSMKRSDLTGAIASIGAKEIKEGVSTSLEQAMQGRVAGVQITQNSGAPGGGISVSIRGITSLNGNEPLYVIDGIAISGQTNSNSSVLSTINPADIVSIEVLKDASATAIYGSRASNGVVMIVTKQGENGKPRLSYDGYFGLQQLPKKLEVMNLKEYAQFYNERAAIQGWGEREEFRDPNLLTNGTDWQAELFRMAPMHNHQIGIAGGNNSAKYALSAGFLNQEGIGLGSNFQRFSFRSNIDLKIASWINVGVNSSFANTKQTTTLDANDIIRTAIRQRPDVPARNPDGSYGEIAVDDYNTYFSNPLAEAQIRENYNTGSQLYYNFYANLNLLPGLTFRAEYGGNLSYFNNYRFTPNYKYGNQIWTSESYRDSGKSNYWSQKSYLTYDLKVAGKHNFQIMTGHEAQESKWENLWGSRTKYFTNSVHSLSAGDDSTAKNGDDSNEWAIESYYGRFNYNFDDRYLFTSTFRVDGSSSFGPNNRWGTFPSAAFAWRIKNEPFLKDAEVINNLKLRLGWGLVGNQNASLYAYGVAMNTTPTYWGTGFYAGNYGNPDLQWEETEAYNLGLDLALFKNRLELIIDAYSKNTDKLLMTETLPSYIIDSANNLAIQAPWVNTGALNNKGMEFTLNTVNITNRDFVWTSNLTFSFNRNKITKLYSKSSQKPGKIGNDIYTLSEIGQPVGQIFGYNIIGMFTCENDFYHSDGTPVARPEESGTNKPYDIAENKIWIGDYIFEDLDNNRIINEKDRKYLGNTQPKFIYGINNTFNCKNFELGIFFNGVYGNKIYNLLRQSNTDTSGYDGKLKEVAGYARVELIDPNGGRVLSNMRVTNNATAQRIFAAGGSTNDNNRISSRFVEDGSYLRLKNISLSYTVPHPCLQSLRIDFMQLYVNIQNLFTITKYSGYDPEVGSYDVLTAGLDNARYPSQRIYTFGLRFNF